MKEMETDQKRHPIRVAAERAGLTPAVLRAWESRYATVTPGRSGAGQRRYSDRDVARLDRLRRATEAGRRIGDVVGLSDLELDALLREDAVHRAAAGARAGGRGDAVGALLADAVHAAEELDGPRLRSLLSRAFVALTPLDLVADFVAPLMRRIGGLWEEGRIDPGNEHLVTVAVRQVLGEALAAASPPAGGPALVVATPAGERHEIGALMAAVTAAAEGWAVTYLGPDLPAAAIARAARRRDARAVAVSVVYRGAADVMARELSDLRDAVDAEVVVLAGGEGTRGLADHLDRLGIRAIGDVGDLGPVLAALAGR